MKQIIKSEDCMNCKDPCCRFSVNLQEYAPILSRAEYNKAIKKGFSKRLFNKLGKNTFQIRLIKKDSHICLCPLCNDQGLCSLYDVGIYYCRIWPFYLMRGSGKDKKNIYLVIDYLENCPAIKNISEKEMKRYINYLKEYLQSKRMIRFFNEHPELIRDYDYDYTRICIMNILTKELNGEKV